MTDWDALQRTVRRIGAIVVVLLGANTHLLVRSTEAYQVGRSHHALFAWASLAGFWLGLAYLAGSFGYDAVTGSPVATGQER